MALWGTLGGRSLVEPEKLAVALAESDPPGPTDWLPLVNRYACPIGLSPGRGHVLLLKSDLDNLSRPTGGVTSSTQVTGSGLLGKFKLVFGDTDGNTITFPNMRIVGHPRCLSFGAPDPCYLVEIADCRVDLVGAAPSRYQWRYNPNDLNATASSVFSWTALIGDLWAQLPTLGTMPLLPADVPTPGTSTVDRIDLQGFPTRDALSDALSAIGCAAAYDPITDSWSIVYFPTAPDRSEVVRNKYTLIYDERPYAPTDYGPLPPNVGVLFPTWMPGRSDREPRYFYSVAVPQPAGLKIGGDVTLGGSAQAAYLQDYTPARTWPDNAHVMNDALVAARATQVARIFYDRFTIGAARSPVRQAFSGLLNDRDVRPGNTYDLVSWSIGTGGPVTAVARAGMASTVELYNAPPTTGIINSWPSAISKDTNGVPIRTGGLIPSPDRILDAAGAMPERRWVTVAGPAAGALAQTASALRVGDWQSIGVGARTDHRARLWRNWEDAGPHDMDRFVVVSGGSKSTTIQGQTVIVWPCTVLVQDNIPSLWQTEETAYVLGANGETLQSGWGYLCRAGSPPADDGTTVWATFCCPGGSGGGGGGVGQGGTVFPCPCTSIPNTITLLTSSTWAPMSGKTHNLTATGVGGWGTATFDSSVDESPATLDYGFTLHVECIMVAGKLTPTVKQNGLFGPYGCILNPTNPPDALPVTIFSCNPFHARAGPFPIIAGGGGGCGGVGQNLYVDLFG